MYPGADGRMEPTCKNIKRYSAAMSGSTHPNPNMSEYNARESNKKTKKLSATIAKIQ